MPRMIELKQESLDWGALLTHQLHSLLQAEAGLPIASRGLWDAKLDSASLPKPFGGLHSLGIAKVWSTAICSSHLVSLQFYAVPTEKTHVRS